MQARINLLPTEDIERKPLGKFLKWILSYGRYIIISVELIVLLVFFSRFILDRKLADLSDSIDQKRAIILSASQLENNIRDFQKNLEMVKSLEDKRTVYIQIIDDLKSFIPKDVFFKKISFDSEKISLEGAAVTNSGFANLLSSLKDNEEIEEIDLNEVKKNEEENLVEFKISANIKSLVEKNTQIQAQNTIDTNTNQNEAAVE